MSRLALLACLFLTVPVSHHALAFVTPLSPPRPMPKVPPGFAVELVLEAPAIEAPTALCVAPNGDVYFAEDPMDMRGPPTKNIDKIWLLERGDPGKKVLIADKMWAVMGLELVGNKLYVVHAPYVSVFTLDRRGRPAKREDLFNDLGPRVAGLPSFNDHIPSGIRMGMDGWLYVSIGDKGIPKMARKEKHLGSVHVAEGRWRWSKEGHHVSLEGGGVIRFRPDGSGLEVFAAGTRNHLDVPLDEHDRIFVRDNTDDGAGWDTRFMYLPRGARMGYPWAHTRRPKEVLPPIADFGGGSPCGGWVYLDDGLPEKYRGRIFHCEWGKGLVSAVKVAPQGAGFKLVDEIVFMGPTGTGVKDFRPFTLRPTADGRGFYVTDWGHSGWLNNKKAGRIWKVTYTGKDVSPAPRGKEADTVAGLVKALDHPAHGERLRIQRRLEEKARETPAEHNAFFKLAAAAIADPKKGPKAKQHLLWAARAIDARGELEGALSRTARLAGLALASKDVGPRLEAVRVATEVKAHAILIAAHADPQPEVRLQAGLGLGATHHFRAVKNLDEPDVFVRRALADALKKRGTVWTWKPLLDELASTTRPNVRETLQLAFADEYNATAVKQLAEALPTFKDEALRAWAVEALGRVYKDRKLYAGTWWGTQPARQKPPPRDVAWEGTPVVREAVLGALADRSAAVRKAAVLALLDMNDPVTLKPLAAQFAREKDGATRADVLRAVAGLRTADKVPFLVDVLRERRHPEALRREAIAGLEKAGTPAAVAALAAVAGPAEPAAVQIAALNALGALKARTAEAALVKGLASAEPAVRRAAATALGQLGDRSVAKHLLPRLGDRDPTVRAASIQALGALKARDAVPALIKAASEEGTQFDALGALAKMPDKRALSAYLTGLSSKNADLRTASRQALTAVRMEVLPALEQLVKRREVPADLLPELRGIYATFSPIVEWKLIGPFPDNGKAHPPERELKFDAAYAGAGQQVKWAPARAALFSHGKVNLASRFSPTENAVAYAHAEIESATARSAELLLGSDDTLAVWLNGKKAFDFNGSRAWAYNQDKVRVTLQKGKNSLLVRCGNQSGPWEFSVAVSGEAERYAFLQGGKAKLGLEDYRAFARRSAGDAKRGERLFHDLKGLACVKCHAVAGRGGQVGPEMAGIGLRYKREELMTSILEPSKVIAQGYETLVVTTTAGRTLTGVFKGETADAINLTDAEGKAHSVLKKNVEERAFSPVSTMPNGLNEGMTLQDFADLIAYLEARREEKVPKKK